MPKNKGNKHAQKGDEPAASYLQARCLPSDKAAWVRAANLRGLKLTEWVVQALNREALIGVDDLDQVDGSGLAVARADVGDVEALGKSAGHVEAEAGGDDGAAGRRYVEGNDPGRGVDGPAG